MAKKDVEPKSPLEPTGPSCGHCGYRFGQVWLCPLHAAAPEMADALRNILFYADTGRTETRWTDKDGIAEPGSLANSDTVRALLAKIDGSAS